jgi:hypothetical protein
MADCFPVNCQECIYGSHLVLIYTIYSCMALNSPKAADDIRHKEKAKERSAAKLQ